MDPTEIYTPETGFRKIEPETEPEEGSPPFWSRLKGNAVELVEFVAVILAVLVVIRFFIAEPHKVFGSSMVPNFHNGDYIITNKIGLKIGEPRRGEVVILQNPRNPDVVFIKRIIGMPGDSVKILNGSFYINGKKLNEPYLPDGTSTSGMAFLTEGEEITVPEGQYFVVGDNRNGSSDSREWGPVKKEALIGQAWLRYWPPQKFTLINIDQPSL